MKVAAIIEARMGSRRLPEKTLADICGATLLERVIERIRPASSVHEVIVATTVHKNDDPIFDLCRKMNVPCFRGSEDDVLDRVYRAAVAHHTDIIVQSGADCPFYDPELIDLLVYIMKWSGYAYTANDMKLTFPEGIDAHVIAFDALEASAREALDPREREDTPRFIWNSPERFPIFNLEAQAGSLLNRPEIRLTVDYPEDLELTRVIYQSLYTPDKAFSSRDVIRFLDSHPQYKSLNSHCKQESAAYL